MSKQAHSVADELALDRELALHEPELDEAATRRRARPIPRISIQAFCEDSKTAEVLQGATADRRLAKSHVSVHMGGASAAVAHYMENPTPNLIIIERRCRTGRCWPSGPARGVLAMPAPRSS